MKAVYFASVRERIGKQEETLAPPPDVLTIGALMAWLSQRDPGYAAAFATPKTIRAAIDRVHVRHDASIAGASEIAFFPPMTGG